jgi:hypothetical protein
MPRHSFYSRFATHDSRSSSSYAQEQPQPQSPHVFTSQLSGYPGVRGLPPFSTISVHGACSDAVGALKPTPASTPPNPSGTRHRPLIYPEPRRGRHLRSCVALPCGNACPPLMFLRNLQTFQHSNFSTRAYANPFIITSFADPHHLTLIESYLCKKQGEGCRPRSSTRFLSLITVLSLTPIKSYSSHTPHPLIPVESYSCKKQGEGVGDTESLFRL